MKLVTEIERKVNECNSTIDKENELLIRIKNDDSVLDSLNKQHEQLQATSEQCISTIKSYNEFVENNTKYIEGINVYFDKKWQEEESKWWEWNIIDIISWFKYKTIGMDTNDVNWKSIEAEMKKRNINGKSLENFNNLTLDMIGLYDFNVAVHIMKAIATLRTKHKCDGDGDGDGMDNDDDAKENGENREDKIPSKFICPLTKQIMRDPVIAFDGYVYEREAITQQLKEKGTSPITGAKAYVMDVFSRGELKREIEAYCNVNNIFSAVEGDGSDTVYVQ